MIPGNLTYRYKCSRTREAEEAERERAEFTWVHPAAGRPSAAAAHRLLPHSGGASRRRGETFPCGGWSLTHRGGGMESFPREQLHPGDGWRVRREARTFLGGSYTLVHKVNGGREMGTNAAPTALCGAGEGSTDSPGQPPPPQPAWSAAKPHKNATRSHDLRRTCNSLPSPGRPCAILYWRSYKSRHELLLSRSSPAPLLTAPALFGNEKPRPGPAFLFTSSSGIPRPWSPPSRWDHGARFLPLHQPPPAAPQPCPAAAAPAAGWCQRQPIGARRASPASLVIGSRAAPSPLLTQSPPRFAAEPQPRQKWGEGNRRGREEKKTLHKKPTTKPTKTPAAISRNNRQNPSEQPQPSALRRERKRETRDTRTEELDRKKYP